MPSRSANVSRGLEVDRFVADLLVEFINPITLGMALAVQQELREKAQLEQGDRLRGQQVERAPAMKRNCMLSAPIHARRS